MNNINNIASQHSGCDRVISPMKAVCVSSLLALLAMSAVHADTGVFELGSVVVRGTGVDAVLPGESVITQHEMQQFNRDNVGAAVSTQPGVSSTSGGGRNEQTVHVRGFDSRQVPIFMDGIPLYVPYDGNVDLSRFTTFDLSEIRVAKGAASLLYGPNIMGGAINLVSRKPTKEFEGNVRLGYASGQQRKFAANVGSNQGLWYFQAGVSYLESNSYPLGHNFRDQKAIPTDEGGYRENAYSTDKKASFKIGLTPNATDEYAFGYVKQEGKKGNPAYTGESNLPRAVDRFWQWPYWDKESIYFLSTTQVGADHTIKFRLYEDTYKNGMDEFKDATYTTLKSPRSVYDDKSRGGSMELISRAFDKHELHLALHYKEDQHTDQDMHYRDVTTSVAVEDLIALSDTWRLRVGGSYEKRDAREVYYWPTGSTNATNGLVELSHDLNDNIEVFTSLAYKTRFPTIKDRYSARMGRALPNPDLKPEHARHIELGLRGEPWANGYVEATVFASDIKDVIQNMTVASTACRGTSCDQQQNVGKARYTGVELSLRHRFSSQWEGGLAYTYLNRKNRSHPNIRLTGSPEHRVFAHVSWTPSAQWEFMATLEAEKGRYDSFAMRGWKEDKYEKLTGFTNLGLKSIWKPRKDIALEVGVSNLTDRAYELSEGYPMPGRVWFANASYRF